MASQLVEVGAGGSAADAGTHDVAATGDGEAAGDKPRTGLQSALLGLAPLLVVNLVLWLTFWQLRHITVYLDSDSGHYLADADALFGDGVRESRHLPGFPVLLAMLRLGTSDLTAVWLAMALVLLGLFGAFWFFVKGRVGSPIAQLAGSFVFLCTPLVAEAVGWYGAAMLMGLALSLLAMRLIDEAIAEPRPTNVVAAGLSVGAVGVTHPFSVAFLAQVSVLALAVLGVGAAWRARRERSWRPLALKRRILAAFGVGAVAATFIAPVLTFYLSLDNPVSLRAAASQLSLVPLWAFREDPILWIALLLGGLLLLPGARLLAAREQARLAIWTGAVAVVALANVVASGGNGSYITRNLYTLPIVLGVGVALAVTRVGRLLVPLAGRRRAVSVVAVVLVATTLAVRIGDLYVERLRAALPYYNTLTGGEFDAITWLRGKSGTVLVTPKFDDQNAGTLYSWMIEGLAHMRAMGPGESYLYLLQRAVDESTDAQRVIEGSRVLEQGGIRVATSSGAAAPVNLSVLVGGTWYPLLSLDASAAGSPESSSSTALGPAARTSTVAAGAMGSADLTLSLPPALSGVVARGGTAGPVSPSSLHEAEGRVTYRQRMGDRQVVVDIRATPEAGMSGQHVPRSRSRWSRRTPPRELEIRATRPAAGTPWALRVKVSGLDHVRAAPPVSWDERELIRKRSFTYVYTWTGSPLAEALQSRACFSTAAANDEVTILAVRRSCRTAAAGEAAR